RCRDPGGDVSHLRPQPQPWCAGCQQRPRGRGAAGQRGGQMMTPSSSSRDQQRNVAMASLASNRSAAAGRGRASRLSAFAAGLFAAMCSVSAISGVAIDNKPLTVTNTVPGNMVLLPSVEWPTVVTHANATGVGEESESYSTGTAFAGFVYSGICYSYQ